MSPGEKMKKVPTSWLVFLLVAFVCVMVAGAVLVNGREGVSGGDGGGVMTAGIGGGTTHFSNLSAEDVAVTDDLTVTDDTTVGGDLTVTGAASVGGDLTVTGDTVVSGYARIASVTAISVTDGCTITPTGTYQPLESAGTVGCGDIVTGTAGDRLVLINTSDTSITITDTGSLKLGANRALAQYDSLELWSDGTYWIELGYGENGTGTTTFSNLAATDLAVADDLTVTDTASVGGDLTVTGVVTGSTEVYAADLTATDDLDVTDDASVGGNLTVTGDQTFTGDGTANGWWTITSLLLYEPPAGMLLVEGGVITPTSTFCRIYAESAVTVTLVAEGPFCAGTFVIIENMSGDGDILIQDTGAGHLNGDVTLGVEDTLVIINDGSDWLELCRNVN